MGKFTTYDDLMRQCEFFNKVGKQCHEEGFTFLYHNHDHEFRTFNGKSIMDHMVENTDPDYLSLELDTFWVMRAGLNPVEQLKHFGKRVKLVHQKDFAWDSLAPINTIGLTPEDYEMKPGESAGIDGGSDYAKNGGKHVITEDEAARARYIRSTSFTEIGMGIMPIQAIILPLFSKFITDRWVRSTSIPKPFWLKPASIRFRFISCPKGRKCRRLRGKCRL